MKEAEQDSDEGCLKFVYKEIEYREKELTLQEDYLRVSRYRNEQKKKLEIKSFIDVNNNSSEFSE